MVWKRYALIPDILVAQGFGATTFARIVRELVTLPSEFKDPLVRLRRGLERYVRFGLKNPQHYLATLVIPNGVEEDQDTLSRLQAPDSNGMRAGESVSTQFDSPNLTVADRSRVRVRVDVDETDVAKLAVGQRAYVTADAYGDRPSHGRVVGIGQILGRKNFRTDEPTERVDTKILETLLELDEGHELPLGLRVQAFLSAR